VGTGLDLNLDPLCAQEIGFGPDVGPLRAVCGSSEPKDGLNVFVGDN